MGNQHLLRRRMLSGFLVMALAATLMTTIVALTVREKKEPAIFISGMELRTVMLDTDGDGVKETPTVQGLVSLAARGGYVTIGTEEVSVDKLKTVTVMLEYNPDYLYPSNWDTNKPYTNAISSGDPNPDNPNLHPMSHLFFHTNEELYWTETADGRKVADPFTWNLKNETGGLKTSAAAVRERETLSLNLTVENSLTPTFDPDDPTKDGLIGEVRSSLTHRALGQYIHLPNDPADKGDTFVVLGTLSFCVGWNKDESKVDRDQVAKMIRLFHESPGAVGTITDGEPRENRMIRLAEVEKADELKYSLEYYRNFPRSYPDWQIQSLGDKSAIKIPCNLWFEFVDAILDAEVVRKDVTVNSYQAYTTGEVSDLARTLQNYADTIRITHASGKKEDVSMRWGEPRGGGMEFTTGGETYRFTWDDTAPLGYTLEKKLDDGTYVPGTYAGGGVYNFTLPDGSPATFVYNRKQGVYDIKQVYAYEENDPLTGASELKFHPVPMKVDLEVTRVELDGLEIDNQTLTFRNLIGEIGYTYASLDLSDVARLRLNTTPGTDVVTSIAGVTPTMPVAWMPNVISEVQVKAPDGTVISRWPLNDGDVTARTGLHIPDDPNVHSADYTFTTFVTNADIEAKYPWLTTVPVAGDRYDLTSLRRIVDDDATVPPLTTADFELQAEPMDKDGNLIIQIARRDPDTENGYLDIGSYDVIDLYRPDGTYIDPAWFAVSNASYAPPQKLNLPWADNKQGYQIIIGTGDRGATDTDAGKRESLQRQINLGGWFGAELATTAGAPRTDRITGYSRPRKNVYMESYTVAPEGYTAGASPKAYFSFTDEEAGLLRVYKDGTLSTLVTLPDIDTGRGETESEKWVKLRYDAVTGAEPGYIRQFKVDQWAAQRNVKLPSGADAVVYGEAAAGDPGEPFAGNYIYSGYGKVENPNDDEKVKVRIQEQKDPAPEIDMREGLSLTYEQFGDTVITRTDLKTGIEEVKRVVFDTKNEGYSWQQVVTLTITNYGPEELHGLYIDGLEDFRYKYDEKGAVTETSGSCFTILSQPAPNLAVGASTTFQISYVPDLKVKDPNEKQIWYEDVTLYVKNDTGDTLRTFEAELQVTREGAYKVDLIVRPEDLSMGTAGFVAGVDVTTRIYDSTPAGASYLPGSTVWVLTQPKDEYALIPKGPYYLSTERETALNEPQLQKDGTPVLDPVSGKPLYKNYLTEYDARNLDAGSPAYKTLEGERLYFFTMPEKSLAVYVDYFEPLRSKLRLHSLLAYAWENGDWYKDPGEDPNDYWIPANQRPLHGVDGENRDVTLFAPGTGKYEVLPVEIPDGTTNGSYKEVLFDPQRSEYVVFLENDDHSCGVSVQLRQLEVLMNALEDNADIKPTIVMTLDDAAHSEIYREVGGTKDLKDPTNKEDVNYIHRSMPFAAPEEPGSSKTVTVDVTYNDSSDNYWTGTEGPVTRSYTVRFMRRPRENQGLHAANPGNSPYGMIMNDDAITQKAEAKAAFDRNDRFTFENNGLTPVKAYTDGTKTAPMLTNIYWPEAWGTGTNYDKEDSSLFVYIGEPFDEPGVTKIVNTAGELVNTTDLSITLTACQLKNTTNLVDKFNGDTPYGPHTLASGLTVTKGVLDELRVDSNFTQLRDLRPGVYALTYTFPDYIDSTDTQRYLSFTRPLIVLAPRGDVDSDLDVDGDDSDDIHSRYSVPLPIDQFSGSNNYPDGDKLVYRYRIVDANNDRNINNIDANLIGRLLRTGETLPRFYLPTDYTHHMPPAP